MCWWNEFNCLFVERNKYRRVLWQKQCLFGAAMHSTIDHGAILRKTTAYAFSCENVLNGSDGADWHLFAIFGGAIREKDKICALSHTCYSNIIIILLFRRQVLLQILLANIYTNMTMWLTLGHWVPLQILVILGINFCSFYRWWMLFHNINSDVDLQCLLLLTLLARTDDTLISIGKKWKFVQNSFA